ncbi:MAG: DUF2029 domain-containing protein [Deltaproteobacteria bacterium]|nr:DUF2029 domain-containing protein [Deltaproteobacteria bacterium]
MAGLVLVYALGLAVNLARHPERYQWDLKTYFAAARAQAQGLDPYDLTALSQAAGQPIKHRFVYPPLTLFLFRPLARLDYDLVYYLFLALKLLALLALLRLWQRRFLRFKAGWLFVPFCLLAFNGALYLDFRAGNVSVFEQLLLWAGLALYLENRLIGFSLLVLAAASFKLTPILFLGLLMLTNQGRERAVFFGAGGLFVLIGLASFLCWPELSAGFWQNMKGLSEGGPWNPASLPLIRDFFRWLGLDLPPAIVWAVYLAAVTVVLAASWRAFHWFKSLGPEQKRRRVVFLACLVYALILPRFKDYAYILLLAPTYFLVTSQERVRGWAVLLAASVLSSGGHGLPGLKGLFKLAWTYYPLLLAFGVWWLHLVQARAGALRSVAGPGRGTDQQASCCEIGT